MLIVYGIGTGYALITGIELSDAQQSMLSEIITNLLYALGITSGVGGAIGVTSRILGTPVPNETSTS
jgi:hypothetical protein